MAFERGHRLFRHLTGRSKCVWVSDRMLPYLDCDPELTDAEYDLIEAHLAQCETCARECMELVETREALAEILYPDDSLPEIDYAAMAKAIQARVANWTPEERAEADRIADAAMRYADGPGEMFASLKAANPKRPVSRCILTSRFVVAAAIACIVMVVVPILAYVGAALIGRVSETPLQTTSDTASNQQSAMSALSQTTAPSTSAVKSTPKTDLAALQDFGLSADVTVQLTKAANEMAARAEVEAMLPHTDAEYEAWARKEYPHIMALYDILTGKPAKAWPDLPEDVQALLAQYAEIANAQSNPLWDGQPVNIPDWAKRLYANTPESDRPTAWRALLIYSEEIFKFDWPKSTQEPNVRPTLDGLKNVAFVAGRVDQSGAAFRPVLRPEPSDSYLGIAAKNNALLDTILTYVAISSREIRTEEFNKLAVASTGTLQVFHGISTPDCTARVRPQMLDAVLKNRNAMITAILGGKVTGSE